MKKEASDIHSFLQLTEYYLVGDLKEIKSICEKAEESDIQNNINPRFAISGLYQTFTTKTPFDIQSTESGFFRLTLPIATSLFATLDFLGYLVGNNTDARATSKNFTEFFKYAKVIGFSTTETEVEIINSVFRQGLAHTYLPKLKAGISYYSGNPIDKLFLNEINKILVLNLRCLEIIVMSVLKDVIANANLINQIETRYMCLQADYENAYATKIENLLRDID